MQSTFAVWSKHHLSITGRITVIRALATSQLWYAASVVPMPGKILQRIESAVWRFLWNDASHGLVNRDVCLASRYQGGLSMVNVPGIISAFHLSWLRHLFLDRSSLPSLFAFAELRQQPVAAALGEHVLTLSPARINSVNCPSDLWRSVLQSAHHLHLSQSTPLSILQLTNRLDGDQLLIDQIDTNKTIRKPLLSSSVHGSSQALTALRAKRPTFSKWDAAITGKVNERRVWSWIWASYRNRKVSDFLWRTVHQCLWLGTNRRYFSHDVNCHLCGVLETYEHLFKDCSASKRFWDWFCSVWKSFCGKSLGTSLESILFGSVSKRGGASKLYWYVLSTVHGELLYTIWLQRCRLIFDNEPTAMSLRILVQVFKQRALSAIGTLQHCDKWAWIFNSSFCQRWCRTLTDVNVKF
jgi:hypothetical protein